LPPVAAPLLPAPPPWLAPDAPPFALPALPPDEAPEAPLLPELAPPEALAPLVPPDPPPSPVFDSLSSPQAVAKQKSGIAMTIAPFVDANKEGLDILLLMASPLGRLSTGLRSRGE
jgi:hypothetical protein